MKNPGLLIVLFTFMTSVSCAQIDSTLLRRVPVDTTVARLNMDAVYNRPFLSVAKTPVSVGGYVEANWQHMGTNGVSEGHQFQMRRLTLFFATSVSSRINFLSEIEFEDGAREINIEFASLDLEFHPLFNLRGGIVMNPIGAFNQNHDGPRWDFVDRPVSATEVLPATWSNVGFGVYGKLFRRNWVYAYELYVTNGFDDQIIANTQNKTFLPASKGNASRFEESFNGVPLTTAKTALRHQAVGELGISYMGGVYNKFREDGIVFDEKRWLHVVALDFTTTLSASGPDLNAEWTWVMIDTPDGYGQQYGARQCGGYLDVVQPLFRSSLGGFSRSLVSAAARTEYVDWNKGDFRETGANIREDLVSLTAGLSWRPTLQTVFRLNYRYQWRTDIFGNRPVKTGGLQFGFSSYF